MISRRGFLGTVEPDDPDTVIVFRGWTFTPPFHCFYCGERISARQFAFARACGGCDVSRSATARLSILDKRAFAGPHEFVGITDPEKLWLEIHPDWLDPATRENYPRLMPRRPLPKPRPVPRPR